jgi:hypothetical protein
VEGAIVIKVLPKLIDRPLQQFDMIQELQRFFYRLRAFAGYVLKKGRKSALGIPYTSSL